MSQESARWGHLKKFADARVAGKPPPWADCPEWQEKIRESKEQQARERVEAIRQRLV